VPVRARSGGVNLPAEMLVEMGEKAGKYFHLAGEQLALVVAQRVPLKWTRAAGPLDGVC
jgi:hypothetical protein